MSQNTSSTANAVPLPLKGKALGSTSNQLPYKSKFDDVSLPGTIKMRNDLHARWCAFVCRHCLLNSQLKKTSHRLVFFITS